MRGLKKTSPNGANTQTDKQTDGHGNSMTVSAQWGRFREKSSKNIMCINVMAIT